VYLGVTPLNGGLEAPPELLAVFVGGSGAVVEVPDVELLQEQRIDEHIVTLLDSVPTKRKQSLLRSTVVVVCCL
jgi:hypothetical protein